MADTRKPYTLTLAGIEHTVLLSPEDAERYGGRAVVMPVKAVLAPANKARTVDNK